MAGTSLFPKTEGPLQKLDSLLTCTLCKKLLNDPHTLTSCGHTFCRSCIVDALSSRASRCPDCSLPGWLKDLRSNRQLANMIRLLTSMTKQISPSTSDIISTSVCDKDEPRSKKVTCTYTCNGALCDHSSTVECGTNQQEDKGRFVEPRVEACLIKRHLKSSKLTDFMIPKLSSNENITNTSTSTNIGSRLHSNTPSPLGQTADNSRKRKYKSTCITEFTTNGNAKVGNRPWKLKHSLAEVQDLGPLKHKEHRSNHRGTPPRWKFPRSPTVTSTYAHDARQCQQGSQYLTPTFPRKVRIQQTSITSEGNLKSPSASLSSNPVRSMRRNIRGETPLHIAAIKGDVSAVRALLQQGAEPNAKDNAGWTPLHEACNHGHVAVVTVLLDNGAFVNVPGLDNDTPLHDAVVNGHVEVAASLISRGANCNLKNCHGTTPRDLAMTESMSKLFADHSYLSPSLLSSASDMTVNYTHHASPQLKGGLNEVVLLGTGLKLHQKNQLEEVAALLGAQVVESFSSAVSHVVAVCDKSGCCPRTLKFLCAVASGKWIVNFKWISQCLQEGRWVNEEPYEVQGVNVGDSAILSEAPRKGRQNRIQQAPGLFDGCEFYFTGNFPPPGASKEDLMHLVRLSGGKSLTREPKSFDQLMSTHPFHAKQNVVPNTFIIYDPCTKQVPHSRKVATVPASWLLDCLSYFEFIDLPNV